MWEWKLENINALAYCISDCVGIKFYIYIFLRTINQINSFPSHSLTSVSLILSCVEYLLYLLRGSKKLRKETLYYHFMVIPPRFCCIISYSYFLWMWFRYNFIFLYFCVRHRRLLMRFSHAVLYKLTHILIFTYINTHTIIHWLLF